MHYLLEVRVERKKKPHPECQDLNILLTMCLNSSKLIKQ